MYYLLHSEKAWAGGEGTKCWLVIIPEFELIVVFNGWNIFDKDRPSIEYLSQRVLKAIQ